MSVHVGAKEPGFSYREISLATEKHLRANLLCLWSLKNPVSDPPLNGYPILSRRILVNERTKKARHCQGL